MAIRLQGRSFVPYFRAIGAANMREMPYLRVAPRVVRENGFFFALHAKHLYVCLFNREGRELRATFKSGLFPSFQFCLRFVDDRATTCRNPRAGPHSPRRSSTCSGAFPAARLLQNEGRR